MSRLLRSQVSLIFENEDLFDNFITPLKRNKELSGTIIRLLRAYYESEEVRALVDGVSFEDVIEDGDKVIDSTEAIDKINQMRQTLAMQDFLFTQTEQVLEDGVCEMETLMRTNDIARRKGFMKTESTDVGEALVHLSLEDLTLESKNREDGKPSDNISLEGRVDKIEKTLTDMASIMKSIQEVLSSESISKPATSSADQEDSKTSSLVSEEQVIVSESIGSENSQDMKAISNDSIEESVSKQEDNAIFGNAVHQSEEGIADQYSSNISMQENHSTQVQMGYALQGNLQQVEYPRYEQPFVQRVSEPEPVVSEQISTPVYSNMQEPANRKPYQTIPEPVVTQPYPVVPEQINTPVYSNNVQESAIRKPYQTIPEPVVTQPYPVVPEPVDTIPYPTVPEPVDTLPYAGVSQFQDDMVDNTVEEDATDALADMLRDLL